MTGIHWNNTVTGIHWMYVWHLVHVVRLVDYWALLDPLDHYWLKWDSLYLIIDFQLGFTVSGFYWDPLDISGYFLPRWIQVDANNDPVYKQDHNWYLLGSSAGIHWNYAWLLGSGYLCLAPSGIQWITGPLLGSTGSLLASTAIHWIYSWLQLGFTVYVWLLLGSTLYLLHK
jgi:hypothetical protein